MSVTLPNLVLYDVIQILAFYIIIRLGRRHTDQSFNFDFLIWSDGTSDVTMVMVPTQPSDQVPVYMTTTQVNQVNSALRYKHINCTSFLNRKKTQLKSAKNL